MIEEALRIAIPMIAQFEGLRLRPYLCSAGVPTIGYGSTYYLDGTPVTLIDPEITKDQAAQLLRQTILKTYLPGVMTLCPGLDTPERIAAMVSFAYNLGIGALKASTLRKRINAGRWDEVPGEIRKWNKAGGRVLLGLVRRREAECKLIQ